jgi:type II secretory pathway component PulC
MIGIRVSAIIPGSRWDALGVRNEDVVTEVAGLRLESPESAAQMFQLLATHSDLSLIRDGSNRVRLVAHAKPE